MHLLACDVFIDDRFQFFRKVEISDKVLMRLPVCSVQFTPPGRESGLVSRDERYVSAEQRKLNSNCLANTAGASTHYRPPSA
jgi:hypothetical protein